MTKSSVMRFPFYFILTDTSSGLSKVNHDSFAKFAYLIVISIHFYGFISSFFLSLSFLRTYTKHSRQCFITTPKILVKNTPLRVVFSTLFLLFGNEAKHDLSCIYHLYTLHVAARGFLINGTHTKDDLHLHKSWLKPWQRYILIVTN